MDMMNRLELKASPETGNSQSPEFTVRIHGLAYQFFSSFKGIRVEGVVEVQVFMMGTDRVVLIG